MRQHIGQHIGQHDQTKLQQFSSEDISVSKITLKVERQVNRFQIVSSVRCAYNVTTWQDYLGHFKYQTYTTQNGFQQR